MKTSDKVIEHLLNLLAEKEHLIVALEEELSGIKRDREQVDTKLSELVHSVSELSSEFKLHDAKINKLSRVWEVLPNEPK